ncbi:group II truncated hemoglobin [Vulgatibacter incomptus]|uniref:Hemoglobin-like protein HbO n=1 Tax=Vulgatibacter incomptus TaxID=1391653 RepID=A0A0K1PHI3_9BACT|nr:group II truncated hemoglobin [Vulgatibacter incomptus]AKU92980.1 Hemoglobin-like protein HbO [Vulgatibacter incomptus]
MEAGKWSQSPGETPFEKLGGEDVVRALAMRFYDAMDRDEPALAHLHRLDENGRVHPESREHFALFLRFWLGGPNDYLLQRGHPMLRARHAPFPVDADMRDAWLRAMTTAMDELGLHGEVREFLDGRFAHVAEFLRNVP